MPDAQKKATIDNYKSRYESWENGWKQARDKWTKERGDRLSLAEGKRADYDAKVARERGVEDTLEQRKYDDFEQRALRETFGRFSVGIVAGAGVMLGVLLGLLEATGEINYDEDKSRWEKSRTAGIPENSINIGGFRPSLNLSPLGMALSLELTAMYEMQRPGRIDEKAEATALAVARQGLNMNPFTSTNNDASGSWGETIGKKALQMTPFLNVKAIGEAAEVLDDKPRTTFGTGIKGPFEKQIPYLRENLPESKHPLGQRGDALNRLGRLLDPTRSIEQIRPQSGLPVTPLPSRKKKP